MPGHRFTSFFPLLAALLASLCSAALLATAPLAAAAGDRLVLTGSSTIAPLAVELGKRFEQRNPGVRVDVQSGGSSRGVNDARAGLADIGMASRALTREERTCRATRLPWTASA